MLWGAFNNASTAMMAMSYGMGSISQNIANVNTTGYKNKETLFKTMLSEGKAAPNGPSGPTNIFGVHAVDRYHISNQGTVSQTQRWTDLAISGRGFFMVSPPTVADEAPTAPSVDDASSVQYSRDGSFVMKPGAAGESFFTTQSGHYLLGWEYDDAGVLGSTLSAVNTPADIEMQGAATTAVRLNGNVSATAPLAPHRESMQLTVYDSAFNPQTVNLDFEKTGPNTWQLYPSAGANATPATTPGPITVTFDANGNIVSPANTNVALSWDTTAGSPPTTTTSTAAFDLDLSLLTQKGGSTAILDPEQNGYASGQLTGMSFSGEGDLVATFDNGHVRKLFKVPLATFVSDDSLEPISGNLFRRSAEAGEISVNGVEDVPGGGKFTAQALEASTVDIGDEFTKMVMTQKAYSTNASVFKTADEMTSVARDMLA